METRVALRVDITGGKGWSEGWKGQINLTDIVIEQQPDAVEFIGCHCTNRIVSFKVPCQYTTMLRARLGGPQLGISSSNVALRPQKPYGLLGTGSPGRPPRLSHSF